MLHVGSRPYFPAIDGLLRHTVSSASILLYCSGGSIVKTSPLRLSEAILLEVAGRDAAWEFGGAGLVAGQGTKGSKELMRASSSVGTLSRCRGAVAAGCNSAISDAAGRFQRR